MFGIVRDSSIARAYGRTFAASVEKVGSVALIRLRGRISIDGGDLDVRNLVLHTLSRGERQLLINLKSVSLIDYSGVRELMTAYFTARKQGATIRLCSLSVKLLTLFQMVELLRLFDVHQSEDDGLAAFAVKAARRSKASSRVVLHAERTEPLGPSSRSAPGPIPTTAPNARGTGPCRSRRWSSISVAGTP